MKFVIFFLYILQTHDSQKKKRENNIFYSQPPTKNYHQSFNTIISFGQYMIIIKRSRSSQKDYKIMANMLSILRVIACTII